VAQLAAANGLDPAAPLLAGRALTLPAAGTTGTVQYAAAPAISANAPPYPTPERVTAAQIGQVAAANGVPGSLAAAIGWQESGFNNDLVSSADARGVMQIVPATWQWIQQNMAGGSLAPASAVDNVRGGVLLLRSLLNVTGGDPILAAAGYYQGLASVRQHGMYSDTRQYVNSVMALRSQFGGP
jgi:soluble lytic murein transglycosylase-like protein